MAKKLFLLITIFSLAVIVGCSSSNKQTEEELGTEVSDQGAPVDGQVEDQSGSGDVLADSGENNEAVTDDILGDETSSVASDTSAENLAPSDSTSSENAAPSTSASSENSAPSDANNPFAESTPSPETSSGNVAVDTGEAPSATTNDFFSDSNTSSVKPPVEEPIAPPVVDSEPKSAPAPKPVASLKKIKDQPFHKGKLLANTVYVARSGDTLQKVSQKIYGADKTSEIKKINPGIRSKLRVGDKVYYNSPQRPTDDARLLTYYEDQGIAPEVYITKAGENIRKVSKELLGNKDSWKEVWATNPYIESKGILPPGTKIEYWKNDSTMQIAGETISPSPKEMKLPPIEDVQANVKNTNIPEATLPAPTEAKLPPSTNSGLPPSVPPPVPPAQQPVQAQAPGQVQPQAQAGTDPSAPQEFNPPPPPPPPVAEVKKEVKKRKAMANGENEKSDDSITFALIGALLLAGVAGIVIIRRRRAKQLQMQMEMAELEQQNLGS